MPSFLTATQAEPVPKLVAEKNDSHSLVWAEWSPADAQEPRKREIVSWRVPIIPNWCRSPHATPANPVTCPPEPPRLVVRLLVNQFKYSLTIHPTPGHPLPLSTQSRARPALVPG